MVIFFFELFWNYTHLSNPAHHDAEHSSLSRMVVVAVGLYQIMLLYMVIRGSINMCLIWSAKQLRQKAFFTFAIYFIVLIIISKE